MIAVKWIERETDTKNRIQEDTKMTTVITTIKTIENPTNEGAEISAETSDLTPLQKMKMSPNPVLFKPFSP